MGERSDQIERHIEDQRHELGEHIQELQEKVKSAVDWRAQFDERPMVMLGLAFGGGMLLSAVLPSGGTSKGRSANGDFGSLSRRREVGFSTSENKAELTHAKSNASETWEKASETIDNVKGALLGVAVAKIGSYLEEFIPGFNEHYRKAQASRT